MKLTLAALALATMASAAPQSPKKFTRVPLPGDNYVAGKTLFPGNVIEGYDDDYDTWNKDTWAQHMLDQCKTFDNCTSTLSFSGMLNPFWCCDHV